MTSVLGSGYTTENINIKFNKIRQKYCMRNWANITWLVGWREISKEISKEYWQPKRMVEAIKGR